MPRTIVTGGVGFIGYHLTRALLERGDDVVVIDDFSNAPYPAQNKRRHAEELTRKWRNLRIVEADVTDRKSIAAHFDRVEVVFHLAALAGVRPSFADPARYARVNVEGTATLLELASQAGCERFVFASSSSVYGNSTPLPAREQEPAVVPESPYAASKRGAELVASALCRRAPAVHCAALRYFTVYGPRQRPEMAITLFTRALLARRPITVFGDGSMRRDFTHVDDIVRGTLAAAEKAPPGFREYNLGSGAPIELKALVDLISDVVGKPARVIHEPQPIGDVDATFADISRATEELGWRPCVALRDGLRSVLDWAQRDS